MHLRTHTKPESLGQAGRWQSPYHDTMIDHDKNVGQLLDLLDELGIADDTIVMYTTDNGPHVNTWPDGATTPFRSEKNTNWEGAFRVPRWSAGRARSRPAWSPTRSCSTTTGCRRSSPPPASPTIVDKLKTGPRGRRQARSRCTSTATTCCPYLTGETETPAQGLDLLLGRRRRAWRARSTTGRSSSWSSGRRHAAGLGGAVHGPAGAEAVQPAHRPVRARRHHVEHLLRLVARPRLPRLLRARRSRPSSSQTFNEFPPRQKPAASPSTRRWRSSTPCRRRALSVDGRAESLDRRADEVGDHRLRRPGHRRGRARLRRARRAGGGLRQRRHAVEREAAADPAGLHHPAARRAGGRRPHPARPAAVEGGVRG